MLFVLHHELMCKEFLSSTDEIPDFDNRNLIVLYISNCISLLRCYLICRSATCSSPIYRVCLLCKCLAIRVQIPTRLTVLDTSSTLPRPGSIVNGNFWISNLHFTSCKHLDLGKLRVNIGFNFPLFNIYFFCQ